MKNGFIGIVALSLLFTLSVEAKKVPVGPMPEVDENSNELWDGVDAILAEKTDAGTFYRFEMEQYAKGLQLMLRGNSKQAVEGMMMTTNSYHCTARLGFSYEMSDTLRHQIYNAMVVSHSDIARMRDLHSMEEELELSSIDIMAPKDLSVCSESTIKKVKELNLQ